MHAAPMRPTETVSAEAPLKIGAEKHSTPAPESFGQSWKREMAATGGDNAGTNSSEVSNLADKPPSGNTAYENEKAVERSDPPPNAIQGEGVQLKDEVRVPNQKTASTEMPKIVRANQNGAEGKTIEVVSEAHSAPSASVAPSKQKRDPKAPASVDVRSTAQPQNEPGLVAPSIAPTTAPEVKVKRSQQVEGPVATKGVSSATLPVMLPTIQEFQKDAAIKPLPAADGRAVECSKPHSGVAIAESAANQNTGQLSAGSPSIVPECGAATGSASSVASVLHVGLAATPTTAGAHPLASSDRQESQMNTANSTGENAATAHQIIASSPVRLDVGVFDGTHGWLRIRAELGSGGEVNALLTANTSAHDSLRAVLPELISYLGSEAVGVARVGVHRFGEDSSSMFAATRDQQNSDSPTHGGSDELMQKHSRAQEEESAAVDRNWDGLAPASLCPATNQSVSNRSGLRDWIAGSARTTSGAGSFGIAGVVNGSWLNVCA